MMFNVRNHRDGVVEVTLHRETKKALVWFGLNAVIITGSIVYFRKITTQP